MTNKGSLRLLAVVAVLLLVPAGARPQPAEVKGLLTDPAGAPLSGVTVEILRNGELLRAVTTREDGSFRVPVFFRPEETIELRLTGAGLAGERLRLDPDRLRFRTSTEAYSLSLEVYPAATAARPPSGGGVSAAPPPPPPVEVPSAPVEAPPPPPEAPETHPAENHAIVKVFFATDRRRISHGSLDYGPEPNPSGALFLGRFDVSVPRDHRMARVERPTVITFWREDPNKHFVIVGRRQHSYQQFYREVSDVVRRSARKEAFVFVHGYRVRFASGIYRTAQIAYDLGFDGAPILYSWPSQGTLAGYRTDLQNNTWTIPHLRWFLEDVAAKSGASVIHLIAHSMGNRALVNAIYRIAREERSSPRPRFSQVILTAPDINRAAFEKLAQATVAAAQRTTLYASSNDKALEAARIYQPFQRAGDSNPDVVVVPGVDTIEASTVDTSLLGHSYYAENRSVLSDIFALLREGKSPAERFGIRAIGQAPRRYWSFRP